MHTRGSIYSLISKVTNMFKKCLVFIMILAISGPAFVASPALAKTINRPNKIYKGEIDISRRDLLPKIEGYYKVKNRPDMELGVFIYQNKASVSANTSTKPVVTSFIVPIKSVSYSIPITRFTAKDDKRVTGYLVTNNPTIPLISASGWSSTPQKNVIATYPGIYDLYAWAKDADGNISNPVRDTVAITAPSCSGSPTQSCTILNGTGIKTRTCISGTWSTYSACTVKSCNSGYQISGNECVTIDPPKPPLSCNISDPDSTAVVSGAGWKLPSQWTYRLNTSSVPSSIGATNLPTIASRSYGVWTKAIGNLVTASKGQNTTVNYANFDGQSIITWGTAPAGALAVSYVWASDGVVSEVDTIMNDSFPWYWSNSNSCAYQNVYDAENILTHELGHTMGLNDEYGTEFINNTMFGYGSMMETLKNTLTTGDIAAVKALY